MLVISEEIDCTALHCTAMHCIALHCIPLHHTALHFGIVSVCPNIKYSEKRDGFPYSGLKNVSLLSRSDHCGIEIQKR